MLTHSGLASHTFSSEANPPVKLDGDFVYLVCCRHVLCAKVKPAHLKFKGNKRNVGYCACDHNSPIHVESESDLHVHVLYMYTGSDVPRGMQYS